MGSNLPFAGSPERKKFKLSTCFLCGMKPVQDSLPKNITHQEKAALFRDLLLNPTIRKNNSPSSYNQFMSSTESCADCASLVKKVVALRQEIKGLEAELENGLEESRAKYLNGNGNGFANNNSTGGPSKMHAVGQQNSQTLAGGLSKFPPRYEMELSSEIEDDDESMEEEEDENMPSEHDDTPTERTMQAKNGNSSTTNTTEKISDWICSHCGKAYSTKSNLYLHRKRRVCKKVRPIPQTKTIKGSFPCSICSKILTSHKLRVAHEMRVCKVVYTQDQVEPLTLHTCPLCDKQFVHLTQYRSHYAAHSKVKKPISSKRGKLIGQVEILGRHHQENRSPQRSVSLVAQKKLSPKEIPLESKMPIYKCSLCTKWFVKEDNLTKHYAENHSKATSRNSTTDGEVMNIRTPRNATVTETSRNTPQPNKPNGYNANTDFSTASIDLGETLRGKPRLEVNGYTYNFAKFGKNKRIWSCERLRSEKCYARLHTSSQSLSPVEILGDLGTHNHSPVLGENTIGLDDSDSSILSEFSSQNEMEMEDDESMEDEEEEEDMPQKLDDKATERPVQSKNGHSSTNPTTNHYATHCEVKKSSSSNRGKSVGQVDPLRPHQDNPRPQRNVSLVGQEKISPSDKLLGGKLPIYNCSRCPRWFVKEDNLTKHLTKDHGVTKG